MSKIKKIIFSNELLLKYYMRYVEGESLATLSKELKISKGILSRNFLENNYVLRKGNRRYFLNENYFEKIDTEEKAYWLGFIAADGGISKTGGHKNYNVLSFNLNERDISHLYKIKKALGSSAKINQVKGGGFGKGTFLSGLRINSEKICKDLINQGILPKKSLLLKPPQIDIAFYKDWIRGYLDGDGSICFNKNGNVQISFVGTKEVLTFIDEYLSTGKHKLSKRNLDSDKNNWSLGFGGTKSIINILHFLYDNSSVYLDRKYEKVLKAYSRFEKQFSKVSEGELLESRKDKQTETDI